MSFNYQEIMPSKEQFFELMQTTNWQGIIQLGSDRIFEAHKSELVCYISIR
jgi:hypothetical protein